MSIDTRKESGQVIVLLVISLVVLLGFTALALDGGMVYSDRRHAQNGADTASLAGGGAAASIIEERGIIWDNWERCPETETSAINAAIERALTNSYEIEEWTNVGDTNYVKHECSANDLKVTVEITRDTPTSFAHLLFNGPLRNTVEAITQIRPTRPLFEGHSIVALKDTNCSSSEGWGIELKGTTDVFLSGGGAYSYSCLYGNGNVDMIVTGGDISAVGWVEDNGQPIFDPEPTEYAELIEKETIDPPDCSDFPLQPRPTATTLEPGRYESIRFTSATTDLTLNPGLYCIDNDFYFSGSSITGIGVTIYSENGSFELTANSNHTLSAPTDCDASDTDGCPPALQGVLIYMENGNIKMLGGTVAQYTGTIYAPEGNIEIGGGSSALSDYNVQVIGWTVALHGTPGIGFVFNSGDNFQIPASLNMYR